VTEPTEEETNLIALQQQIEAFLASPVGRYVVCRLEIQQESALAALKTVDPSDTKAIIRNQLLCEMLESPLRWFEDAIAAGDLAYRQYVSRNDGDI